MDVYDARDAAMPRPRPVLLADRRGALAALLGGLLWVPYGVFEMLEPWGTDTAYRDERGYEVVTDSLLYRLYSLPGSLALLLTALGLVGMVALAGGWTARIARGSAYIALVLAIVSTVGVGTQFDPLFTAPRIFGTLALGVGMLLAGITARRAGASPLWWVALLATGLLGLLLLPLWPLVHALEVIPTAGGATVIALLVMTLWSFELQSELDGAEEDRPQLISSMAPSALQSFQLQSECEQCDTAGRMLADPQKAEALMVAWNLDPGEAQEVWCEEGNGARTLVANLQANDTGEVVQSLAFDQPIAGYKRIFVTSEDGEIVEIRMSDLLGEPITPETRIGVQ